MVKGTEEIRIEYLIHEEVRKQVKLLSHNRDDEDMIDKDNALSFGESFHKTIEKYFDNSVELNFHGAAV